MDAGIVLHKAENRKSCGFQHYGMFAEHRCQVRLPEGVTQAPIALAEHTAALLQLSVLLAGHNPCSRSTFWRTCG